MRINEWRARRAAILSSNNRLLSDVTLHPSLIWARYILLHYVENCVIVDTENKALEFSPKIQIQQVL